MKSYEIVVYLSMPGYEFSLIVKSMARPKIVEAVKRAAGKVYESGGYIR